MDKVNDVALVQLRLKEIRSSLGPELFTHNCKFMKHRTRFEEFDL